MTIKSASRDPGVRAKIAVHTSDARIDQLDMCWGPWQSGAGGYS